MFLGVLGFQIFRLTLRLERSILGSVGHEGGCHFWVWVGALKVLSWVMRLWVHGESTILVSEYVWRHHWVTMIHFGLGALLAKWRVMGFHYVRVGHLVLGESRLLHAHKLSVVGVGRVKPALGSWKASIMHL